MMKIPFVLVLVSLALCACAQEPLVFSYKMSEEEWQQLQKRCYYEADRATASLRSPFVAATRRHDLYVECLEANGATYVSGPR